MTVFQGRKYVFLVKNGYFRGSNMAKMAIFTGVFRMFTLLYTYSRTVENGHFRVFQMGHFHEFEVKNGYFDYFTNNSIAK